MTIYTKDFQIQLLATLCHDLNLLKNNYDFLTIDDFDLASCKLIYEALVKYYKQYTKLPNFDILVIEIERRIKAPEQVEILPEELESLGIILERINLTNPETLDPAYFTSQIPSFKRHVLTQRTLNEHTKQAAVGRSENMDSLVKQIMDIHSATNRATNSISFDDAYDISREVTTEEPLIQLPFNTTKLNKYTRGGLRTTGVGLVTACPGVGKTNTLLNFASAASNAGFRCLFITLELTKQRISDRYLSIAHCITAGLPETPFDLWPPHELELYHMVMEQKQRYKDYMTIVDLSHGTKFNIDDIDRMIEDWLIQMRKKYGQAEADRVCKGVYIDWLDRIAPNEDQKWKKQFELHPENLYKLGAMGRRYDVGIWSATQATAEGDGAVEIRQKHTSFGFHKNDGLDIGIGVSPVEDVTIEEDDMYNYGGAQTCTAMKCSKTLNYNINKNRDSTLGCVQLYMGPPLRLFDDPQDWYEIDTRLKKKDYSILGF